ncbi:hypothetical protein CRUP_018114 [Coryphaenoides rupestris]|nr:hypothetical protein CRUP_018114 [Coryphaenoides rupestris]
MSTRGPSGASRWSGNRRTVALSSPSFSARPQTAELSATCGIECQRRLPSPSLLDLEQFLSYETVYENGTRTLTSVSVQDLGGEAGGWPRNSSRRLADPSAKSRRKREVYGTDTRFTIGDKMFSTKYPFSTTVKISTGCSGVLLSPKHVLTAAHCIHDGQDYLSGAQKLRVGVLKERSRKGKGGKGKGGRGGKGKRRKEEEEDREEKEKKGKGKGKKSRSRRSADRADKPSFKWEPGVRRTAGPGKRLVSRSGAGRGGVPIRPVGGGLTTTPVLGAEEGGRRLKHMDLGGGAVREEACPAGRIHFSGFDDGPRSGNLRVPLLLVVSDGVRPTLLVIQYAERRRAGSGGSGVYIRAQKEPGRKKLGKEER